MVSQEINVAAMEVEEFAPHESEDDWSIASEHDEQNPRCDPTPFLSNENSLKKRHEENQPEEQEDPRPRYYSVKMLQLEQLKEQHAELKKENARLWEFFGNRIKDQREIGCNTD